MAPTGRAAPRRTSRAWRSTRQQWRRSIAERRRIGVCSRDHLNLSLSSRRRRRRFGRPPLSFAPPGLAWVSARAVAPAAVAGPAMAPAVALAPSASPSSTSSTAGADRCGEAGRERPVEFSVAVTMLPCSGESTPGLLGRDWPISGSSILPPCFGIPSPSLTLLPLASSGQPVQPCSLALSGH